VASTNTKIAVYLLLICRDVLDRGGFLLLKDIARIFLHTALHGAIENLYLYPRQKDLIMSHFQGCITFVFTQIGIKLSEKSSTVI
jgi:hypothetical protein